MSRQGECATVAGQQLQIEGARRNEKQDQGLRAIRPRSWSLLIQGLQDGENPSLVKTHGSLDNVDPGRTTDSCSKAASATWAADLMFGLVPNSI